MTRMKEFVATIDEGTKLPIKVIVPLMMGMMTATWLICSQIQVVKAQVTKVSDKMDGSWTVGNMQLWAERMQARNPALHIPDVTEVAREQANLRRRDRQERQMELESYGVN